jgi:hypothetical protein
VGLQGGGSHQGVGRGTKEGDAYACLWPLAAARQRCTYRVAAEQRHGYSHTRLTVSVWLRESNARGCGVSLECVCVWKVL